MKNNSQKYYKSMFKDYPDVVNVKQLQTMLGGISKRLAYYLLKIIYLIPLKLDENIKLQKLM